jgi:hypothetical protein
VIHGDFDHFDSAIIDPRQTALVQADVIDGISNGHEAELPFKTAGGKSNAMLKAFQSRIPFTTSMLAL